MKKLYPSGRAMPTRTGPSEPTQSSHATSSERMTTSHRSLLRAKSISPFYSYRRRAKVSSMSATSNLYDVLKRVDWLAIFSPWALINKAKRYTTLLLPTIFVSVFICFSGAAKAQSRQDVGTAEVVIQGEVRSAVDGQPLEGVIIRLRNQTRITDAQGEFSIRTDLTKGHIEARHIGYESVTVPFDFRSNIINISLKLAKRHTSDFLLTLGNERWPMDSLVTRRFDQALTDQHIANKTVENIEDYPLYWYKVVPERIPRLMVGEIIPEEILNLPFRVVNDSLGRQYLTLKELSDTKFVVLDFWARWCSPCLESIAKWEGLHTLIRDDISVLGVNIDFDFWAALYADDRQWKNTQVIGQAGYFFAQYFLGEVVVGPSVWIKDGRFFGVTKARQDSHGYIADLLDGRIDELPTEARSPLGYPAIESH